MPVPATTASELQSSLSKLSIGEKGPIKDVQRPQPTIHTRSQPKSARKPKEQVAESWEDEANSSEDEETTTAGDDKEYQENHSSSSTSGPSPSEVASPSITNPEGPLCPPPTPISPPAGSAPSPHPWQGPTSAGGEYGPSGPSSSQSSSGHRSPTSGSGTVRRPEKQTAVAGRMIAGALGIRAPKRTPEERAYDRAVKEQEIKRRNREKEEAAREREEEEKAKAAVWDE